MTRPTIERTQVRPDAAGRPTAVSSQCQATSTSSTTHLSGQRMVPIRSKPPEAGAGDGCGAGEQKVKTHRSVLSGRDDETVSGQVVTEVFVRTDVIDAAVTPGIATEDAPRREQRSPHGAVLLHRTYSVSRTGGVVGTDISVHRGDHLAVPGEESEHQIPGHQAGCCAAGHRRASVPCRSRTRAGQSCSTPRTSSSIRGSGSHRRSARRSSRSRMQEGHG